LQEEILFWAIPSKQGLTGTAAARRIPALSERGIVRWIRIAKEPCVVDTTTVETTIRLGLWIAALHKYPAKVEPPGWPGTAAPRKILVGSRKENLRETATLTRSARTTSFVGKITVLLLEGRTPTPGWTVVFLRTTHLLQRQQRLQQQNWEQHQLSLQQHREQRQLQHQ